MIAPQELRLGNLVTDSSGRIFKVMELLSGYLRVYIEKKDWLNSQNKSYIDLEPIELTEEWLIMFGFEKREDEKYYHHKYDRTWVKIESCIVKWYGNATGGLVMIDYVHQLQNCFNVFTGKI